MAPLACSWQHWFRINPVVFLFDWKKIMLAEMTSLSCGKGGAISLRLMSLIKPEDPHHDLFSVTIIATPCTYWAIMTSYSVVTPDHTELWRLGQILSIGARSPPSDNRFASDRTWSNCHLKHGWVSAVPDSLISVPSSLIFGPENLRPFKKTSLARAN